MDDNVATVKRSGAKLQLAIKVCLAATFQHFRILNNRNSTDRLLPYLSRNANRKKSEMNVVGKANGLDKSKHRRPPYTRLSIRLFAIRRGSGNPGIHSRRLHDFFCFKYVQTYHLLNVYKKCSSCWQWIKLCQMLFITRDPSTWVLKRACVCKNDSRNTELKSQGKKRTVWQRTEAIG